MSATEQTSHVSLSESLKGARLEDYQMITDDFDERTIANMEVALDRACERFPKQLASHEARKRIAAQILERAAGGERTLKALTDTAIKAAMAIGSKNPASHQVA
jgi:hypothetical protein